ncbi:MAG TPA: iron donor protein CyaY [Chromatiaceae bacterium]|nr:iron donor protein CyaY [Chromatiaceae bacterium]
MNDTSFELRAEQTLESIVEALEALEALDDTEIDLIDGVLTLEFDDGSQIIMNRQAAANQLWMASPDGPAHFDMRDDGWKNDKTGEDLADALGGALSRKLGSRVAIVI